MTIQPSGIYKITNNWNGKVYVGQSKNIFFRKKQHFQQLEKGIHENKPLQLDYNKYKKYFNWQVIEYCNLDKLNEREKYWIDKLNTFYPQGYNLTWSPFIRKEKIKNKKVKKYHKTS